MAPLTGTLLRVDLSSATTERCPMPEYLRRDYAGGRGINSRLLFEEVGPEVDPLSPENRLIFASGPLSGTAAPCAGRFTVTAKSPQTGILGDANAGGRFGPALKRAGIDHLVISGKSEAPVYLFIDNEKTEIRCARHLKGMDIRRTEALIKEELGDRRVRVAAIGPAGENLVRIAAILHEDRSASRTGVGAVMGSKNLKAVAVRGTGTVPLHDPENFKKLAGELNARIARSPAFTHYRKFAGIGGVVPTNTGGFLAVRNFQQAGEYENIENFSAAAVAGKYYVGSRPCYGCPVGCGNKNRIQDGPFAGEWSYKIEEGAYTPLGPVCGNADMDSIFKMNNMANHLGIDLIEFGQGMATVMEWYEKGIVSREDLDGIEMTWGNSEAMMQMLEKIAFREGIGDILSEGIVRAAPAFGPEAVKCVSHCKGMQMAGIDCRMLKGTALGFATSTRGSDHLRCLVPAEFKWFSKMTPEEAVEKFGTADVLDPLSYNKASAEILYQHQFTITDLMAVCRFAAREDSPDYAYEDLCRLYSLATGIPTDKTEMLKIAERVQNVERAFLCREGIRRADDWLVGKWGTDPVPNGPYRGERIDPEKWEGMLDDYYRLRGWRPDGVPSREKLSALGIDDVAEALEKAGC